MSQKKKKTPVLTVNNLSKSYPGGFRAVKNLSFELKPGEILGLLGPNGAGKTTTIQMLLSILKPSQGEIRYFDLDFEKHRSQILQEVAFASTYINLPWRLTLKENLDVYGRLYGLTKEQRTKRMKRLLSYFGIEKKLENNLSSLSAGQRTRAMLVKAFLAFPKIVLLDEPTASLDPDIAVEVRKFVLEQREKYGVSVLFTSHNMTEVAEVCDRVMFLKKGEIVAVDTPANLAKKVNKTIIQLTIGDGAKRTQEVCTNMKLDCQINDRRATIKLEEEQIASLLNNLAAKGVEYSQIDINKPTLEDYFLQISSQRD